jgi:hypothetical protein
MTAAAAMQISFCCSVLFFAVVSAGLMMLPEKSEPSPQGIWEYVDEKGTVLMAAPGFEGSPVVSRDAFGNVWITNRFKPFRGEKK